MELDWLFIQKTVFETVAKKLESKYPDKSLRLVCVEKNEDLIMQDFEFLKANGRIKFDVESKILLNKLAGNPNHPIRLAVYYRDNPVGYAFGCLSNDEFFLEVSYMEKRNDAHADLDHQFLNIVLNAFAAYGITLVSLGIKAKYLALVAPVHGVRNYYEDCGFIYSPRYRNSNCEAMTMQLPNEYDLKNFAFSNRNSQK